MKCQFQICDVSEVIMYLLNETEEHVHTSLREAILLLCQTGLKFNTELSVDGLLAVTVDKQRVFLLSIKETLQANEPCGTSNHTACISTNESPALVNFSSSYPSTVTSADFGDQSQSDSYAEECIGNLPGLRLPGEIPSQREGELATKSDNGCKQHHRKQRHTVPRFLDASHTAASETAMSLELLSQPELISDWVCSESSEVSVHPDNEDKHCNHDRNNDLLRDAGSQRNANDTVMAVTAADTTDRIFSHCGDQKFGTDVISSLSLPLEEQEHHDTETMISLPVPSSSNKQSITDSDHMSKRSHRKRRHTVQRYLDHSASPITSSPTVSLTPLSQTDHSHISGWADSESGEASTLNDVKDDHYGHAMNLSNGSSADSARVECQDASTSLFLPTSVKSEIIEPPSTSSDIISHLASLGHNMRPSCHPQQQMALMSQFCLPAVVSAPRQSAPGSWQLFPWTPPTLPPVPCGMVCVTSFIVVIIHN